MQKSNIPEKLLFEIILPVYNEEKCVRENALKVHSYLKENIKRQKWKITIIDNASIDNTKKIATKLVKEYKDLNYLYIPKKGKGIALQKALKTSEAKYIIVSDVDLPTSLENINKAIRAAEKNHAGIVYGYRPYRKLNANLRRTTYSFVYRFIAKMLFSTKIKDFQAGFKLFHVTKVRKILTGDENHGFFFDTEILIKGEKQRLKIIPLVIDYYYPSNRKSTVHAVRLSISFIKNLFLLRFSK